MTMKLKQLFAAMGFVLAASQAFAGSTLVLETASDLDRQSVGTDVIYIGSHKINDQWSVAVEASNNINYRTDGTNGWDTVHNYIRFPVSQKKVAKLGAFDVNVTYRYTLPTYLDAQRAGTFGTIMARPEISAKFGKLNALVRQTFSVPLNRQAYQVTPPDGGNPAGNPLYAFVTEILPSYEFGDAYVSLNETFIYKRVGAAKGTSDQSWSKAFYSDFEVGYGGDVLKGYSVYVNVSNVGTQAYGTAKTDWKWFDSKKQNVTLGLAKEF